MDAVAAFSSWLVPALCCLIPLYGWSRGVRVYDAFVAGARQGLGMALRILPYMVAILLAVGVFQAGGALALLTAALGPVLRGVGLAPPLVPQILVRPLSGTASLAILAHLLRVYGPDSPVGRLASCLQGSTDTTFYILTIYLGSVGVRRGRYALPVCLIGDAAGAAFAVLACHLFFPT